MGPKGEIMNIKSEGERTTPTVQSIVRRLCYVRHEEDLTEAVQRLVFWSESPTDQKMEHSEFPTVIYPTASVAVPTMVANRV